MATTARRIFTTITLAFRVLALTNTCLAAQPQTHPAQPQTSPVRAALIGSTGQAKDAREARALAKYTLDLAYRMYLVFQKTGAVGGIFVPDELLPTPNKFVFHLEGLGTP